MYLLYKSWVMKRQTHAGIWAGTAIMPGGRSTLITFDDIIDQADPEFRWAIIRALILTY